MTQKRTSLAFNSERLRQLLWQRVAPPPEMLQDALLKLHNQLEAKETKFFTSDGLVVSTQEVEAHAIQQSAAIAITKISDAFPRDRADRPAPPTVTLEIKDGVFRLHIGAVPSSGEEVAYDPRVLNGDEQQTTIDSDDVTEASALASEERRILEANIENEGPSKEDDEPPTQVIQMKDFKNKQEALRILLGDNDNGPTK